MIVYVQNAVEIMRHTRASNTAQNLCNIDKYLGAELRNDRTGKMSVLFGETSDLSRYGHQVDGRTLDRGLCKLV